MEKWLLMEGIQILDTTISSSREDATMFFDNQGWVIGDVLSEADYMAEMELNALENS